MNHTRIHPTTGAVLTRSVRLQPVPGTTHTAPLAGWYPEGAGDSIHTGRDFRDQEAAAHTTQITPIRADTPRKSPDVS